MCHCEYRKPKCEEGRELHSKMTARLLKRGMDMDDEHRRLWRKWMREHVNSTSRTE